MCPFAPRSCGRPATPRRSCCRAGVSLPLCVLFLALAAAPAARADVAIHCLKVGQGDATLIVSSSGQTLLFDAGDNGKGTSVVVPYLTGLGISQLTHIAVSHYHADHLGGVDEVYNAKGVSGAVYDRGWSYTTATYNSYAALVAPKRQTLTDLQVIDLGDGVTATVVAINGSGALSPPYTDGTNDENDFCVGLHVQAGDFDFFVAGDLSGVKDSYYENIESYIATRIGDLEVYHVSHHGSYSASNAYFLSVLQPEVAIISVGNSNTYGHPAQVTLDRLAAAGAFVYQTETGAGGTLPSNQLSVENDHIVIVSDGYGDYTVNGDTWTNDEPDLSDVPSTPAFALLGAWPNPFNPQTNIWFETVRGGPVALTLYDLAGRRLLERAVEAGPGRQAIRWDGRDGRGNALASGVYLFQVRSLEGAGTGRVTLIR